MTISSNTNNFGHADAIQFNAFLSADMVILNGKFTVDTTTAEYAAASVLEISLPGLTLEKSAVANAYIRTSETVTIGAYSSTYQIGTVVKTWISEGGKLCIEKFSHYDDLGQYELLFCTMYAGKNFRGDVAKFTKTTITFTYESSKSVTPSDRICVVQDGWCFLHFYYSNAMSFFREAIKATITGLPTDISADIYLVGGSHQATHKGCWIAEARIENGVFSVPEPSSSAGSTGYEPFVFAFLVRDGVAESSGTDDSGASESSADSTESTE